MFKRGKYHRIYFYVLAFIALLVATSLVVIDFIVSEESLMVEISNIGSRQRMLSERIVHLTLEYAVEEDVEIRNRISNSIKSELDLFDATHKYLIKGRLPGGRMVGFEDNIDNMFFGGPVYLDEKVRLFIYNTREALAHEWSAEFAQGYYTRQLRKSTIRGLDRNLQHLAALYAANSHERILILRLTVAILLGGIILVLFSAGAFVFSPLFEKIYTQEEELKKLAYIDPLTNCQNRRSFLANAEIEFERCRRYSHLYSILFLDIDFFKKVNDRYGHAAGDSLLVEITKVCLHNIRDSDFLGRIGGDELGIVLHECDLAYATETSKKLRDAISNIVISGEFGEIRPSVSIGATMIMDCDESAYDTLKRADQNLYRSKNAGRNQVVAA